MNWLKLDTKRVPNAGGSMGQGATESGVLVASRLMKALVMSPKMNMATGKAAP